MSNEEQRLQKLLSGAGFASRRVVEQLIEEGRITVNGEIATLGDRASSIDDVRVDGQPVILTSDLVTYIINKPAEVLSSASDDRGRHCVVDLIDDETRLFPIGRLDYNTTGLLLVSNDGDLTYRLTHPKFGVDKKYVAELKGNVADESIELLKRGVELDDGMTAPAKVRVLARKTGATLVEIVIHEGRNRQIRRMGEAIGHEVVSLHRNQIGPISDDSLSFGQYRKLGSDEIHALYAATQENSSDNQG